MTAARPTCADIDLDAVRHNVRLLADRAAPAEVCAVVKADGYGHGAVEVARATLDAGATWLAVALVEEGEELRDTGIDAPILVLSEPPPSEAGRLIAASLTPTLYSEEFGRALDQQGRQRGQPVPAHVKADTGMARVGVPRDHWAPFLAACAGWPGVRVDGLWTHLARADEPGAPATGRQLDAFDEFLELAGATGLQPRWRHAANSAGALEHPRARYDLVRCGIAVYGLSPSPEVTARRVGLRPAMTLRSEVSFAKRIAAGTAVSYGHKWSAPADGWLATVPLGYADGVPRLLTNRGEVLIHGERRPIVGSVCMDQILVWCGDDRPAAGDEVVLLGRQGPEEVVADEWANHAETITYEIACGISKRVPRRYMPAPRS